MSSQPVKPESHICIDLTHSELELILRRLGPVDEETDSIHSRLSDLLALNPMASTMYFINTYIEERCYGGPEEGGWFYHSVRCVDSVGVNVCKVAYRTSDDVCFSSLLEMFLEAINDVSDDLVPAEWDAVERAEWEDECIASWEDALRQGHDVDYYLPDGWRVSIERQPARAHDTHRPVFC